MNTVNGINELIGNTPIIKLNKIVEADSADVFVKLESFNPGGSIKDRLAYAMIKIAEETGLINENTLIVEPTSGNTGVGLAMLSAAKGYRLILTMPETMSVERRNLLKAYGAEIILTPGQLGMKGAIDKALELKNSNPNVFIPQQFENEAGPQIHRQTTGVEIYQQMEGQVDAVIAGVGTGGTVSGVGQYLKSQMESIKVIAVEPEASPVISGGQPGVHKIQGIGAGFVPTILDLEVIDEVMKISNDSAMEIARSMAKEEGLLVGISSGASVAAALEIAKKLGQGKKVVAIAPDTGERYLSTELFSV